MISQVEAPSGDGCPVRFGRFTCPVLPFHRFGSSFRSEVTERGGITKIIIIIMINMIIMILLLLLLIIIILILLIHILMIIINK